MEVIILFALIFVILSLANKYLKVPRDNNQRYDGINNRFYGEGYTGDMPVPPSDDEAQDDGQEDLQESGEDDDQDDGQEDGQESGEDDDQGELQGEQADDGTEFEDDGAGEEDQAEFEPDEAGAHRAEDQPIGNTVGLEADQQPDSLGTGNPAHKAPAGDAALYGNTDNTTGVVIDTEVHIDAAMPQDSGKS